MLAKLGDWVAKLLGEQGPGAPDRSCFTSTLDAYGRQPLLSSLFPYESYEEATQLFRTQDSIGFVLETLPLTGASEEMQKEVSSLFQYILPEESSLQTVLWADPHIGNLCDSWKQARNDQDAVIQKLAKRRAAFLEGMAWHANPSGTGHYPYTLRNFRCFLAYSQPDCGSNPVAIDGIVQILGQLKTALEMLRLPVTVWRPEELINTLEGIFCLDPSTSHTRNRRWDPLGSLQSQIGHGEAPMGVGANGISLNQGKVLARTYKVRDYPELWTLHAMGMLIGDAERDMAQIPCPFLIHYGVHVPKQDGPQKKVASKAFYVEAQSQSPIAKYMPAVQREAAELKFVRENLAKGERIVQTSFTLVLFTPQPDEAMEREEERGKGKKLTGAQGPEAQQPPSFPRRTGAALAKAEQILKGLFKGQEWTVESNWGLHLPMLLSVLPMGWGPAMVKSLSNLKKLKTTQSTESSNLLPLQGEWHGTPSPALILAGRRGQVFTWSPFDSSSNYNICVLGQSGAGKSVFMQEIVLGILGLGGRVIVLDIGRSYQKLGQLLGAQFIRITHTSDISLNPFSDLASPKGGTGQQSQDYRNTLGMVKQVLVSMLSPSGTLDDLENSYLEMALDAAASQKGADTEVSDMADWFLAHEDPRAKDMGTRLYSFTRKGTFGKFFSGKSTISFKNRLIIVEFEDIKENKELSAVILQTLIANISNLVYRGNRKTKSALVIDECWEFIKGKAGEALIEGASRTFRKYQWLLLMGSQNAEDFHKSLAAKAAFNNSAWKCYLSQPNEALKAFEKEALVPSPAMLNLLRTVKMVPGKYGETLIVSDSGYAVGRLLLDPFSLMLYSTKADEFSAVESLVNQGVPVDEAIDRLIHQKRKETP